MSRGCIIVLKGRAAVFFLCVIFLNHDPVKIHFKKSTSKSIFVNVLVFCHFLCFLQWSSLLIICVFACVRVNVYINICVSMCADYVYVRAYVFLSICVCVCKLTNMLKNTLITLRVLLNASMFLGYDESYGYFCLCMHNKM